MDCYLSVLGLVRLECCSYHQDLLLVESLVEVFLHFEVRVDGGFVRF